MSWFNYKIQVLQKYASSIPASTWPWRLCVVLGNWAIDQKSRVEVMRMQVSHSEQYTQPKIQGFLFSSGLYKILLIKLRSFNRHFLMNSRYSWVFGYSGLRNNTCKLCFHLFSKSLLCFCSLWASHCMSWFFGFHVSTHWPCSRSISTCVLCDLITSGQIYSTGEDTFEIWSLRPHSEVVWAACDQ